VCVCVCCWIVLGFAPLPVFRYLRVFFATVALTPLSLRWSCSPRFLSAVYAVSSLSSPWLRHLGLIHAPGALFPLLLPCFPSCSTLPALCFSSFRVIPVPGVGSPSFRSFRHRISASPFAIRLCSSPLSSSLFAPCLRHGRSFCHSSSSFVVVAPSSIPRTTLLLFSSFVFVIRLLISSSIPSSSSSSPSCRYCRCAFALPHWFTGCLRFGLAVDSLVIWFYLDSWEFGAFCIATRWYCLDHFRRPRS
jgi:hypothetical protein